jgi:putative SOS response-associated peptidase YedK
MNEKVFLSASKHAYMPAYIQPELDFGMIYPGMKSLILTSKYGMDTGKISTFGWKRTFDGKKKMLINARAESVEERSLFKEAFFQSRCIVCCSSFYEWDHQKKMLEFFTPKHHPIYLAGFHEDNGFVILTTQANDSMIDYHDRMPLMIEEKDLHAWLTSKNFASDWLHHQMPFLEHSAPFS